MHVKAVALYDFMGNPEADEISFHAGDIITVTNMQSDDGWWEGCSNDGKCGFFPELYVELKTPTNEDDSANSPADRIPTPPQFSTIPKAPRPPPIDTSFITNNYSANSSFSTVASNNNNQSENTRVANSSPGHTLFTPSSYKDPSPNPSPGKQVPDSSDSALARKYTMSTGVAQQLAAKLQMQHQARRDSLNRQHESDAISPTMTEFDENENDNHQKVPPSPGISVSDDQSLASLNVIGNGIGYSSNRSQPIAQPMRKSLNRFTKFVSSGAEAYLMNDIKNNVHVFEEDKKQISYEKDGPRWAGGQSEEPQYNLSISGHERKSKYVGTKHYIAYEIVESNSNTKVHRRYKHFVWLHTQLLLKFSTLCLPPLPEKQAQGRFADEFIEARKRGLERYIRRLERHPVIRESTIFVFFITCGEDKAWKAGKRAAERDPIFGSKFLQSIRINGTPVPEDGDSSQVNAFAKHVRSMKVNGHALMDANFGFLYAAPTFQNTYNRVSFALKRLITGGPKDKTCCTNSDGDWCWKETCSDCKKLTATVEALANVLKEISGVWEDHAIHSCIPIIERIREYEGIIDSMSNAVELHERTASKLRDVKKTANDKNVDPEALDAITGRCSTVFNVALAEINRFHDEKGTDYRQIVYAFLDSQAAFHTFMLNKLTEAKSKM